MTATTTAPTPTEPEATPVRFTVAEYVAFADIDPERELELLDGEIYDLAPEYAPHARLVHRTWAGSPRIYSGEVSPIAVRRFVRRSEPSTVRAAAGVS